MHQFWYLVRYRGNTVALHLCSDAGGLYRKMLSLAGVTLLIITQHVFVTDPG